MAKKVSEKTWDEIQKNSAGDYFILDEDKGQVEVVMLSEHYLVESGDKDLAGRIWDKEWPKNEIKALVDQETKIMSLGWTTGAFLRKFVAKCKKNGISPDDLPGTKWTMQKTGEYEYDLRYLGKEDVDTKAKEPVSKESDEYKNIVKTIESLKDEPELAEGKDKGSFLAIVGLKAQIPKADVEKEFDNLVKNNVLKEVDGKIVIQ
jgi:hypothetical protein